VRTGAIARVVARAARVRAGAPFSLPIVFATILAPTGYWLVYPAITADLRAYLSRNAHRYAALLLGFAVEAWSTATRTILAKLHTLRVVLLIFLCHIVALFALSAGERDDDAILFALGGHLPLFLS